MFCFYFHFYYKILWPKKQKQITTSKLGDKGIYLSLQPQSIIVGKSRQELQTIQRLSSRVKSIKNGCVHVLLLACDQFSFFSFIQLRFPD